MVVQVELGVFDPLKAAGATVRIAQTLIERFLDQRARTKFFGDPVEKIRRCIGRVFEQLQAADMHRPLAVFQHQPGRICER